MNIEQHTVMAAIKHKMRSFIVCILSHKYCSAEQIKKKEMWWTGGTYRWFWWGDLRERDHLEDLGGGVGRRWKDNIKVKLQEMEYESIGWIALARDRRRMAGCCECVNEPSGFIKCGEFLD